MDNELHAIEATTIDKRFIGDNRPPLLHLGWAPGNYSNQCRRCGDVFTGDKRAGMCADCAYGIEEADQRPAVNLGTIGHVDHGKMTLAAAIALAMGMEHRYEIRAPRRIFDGPPRRPYPQSPDSKVQASDTKDNHDRDRIAKAEEKRRGRKARRLGNIQR